MIGGVTSGLFLIDYMFRPLMKIGMKFSPAFTFFLVVVFYATLGYYIVRSAWFSDVYR